MTKVLEASVNTISAEVNRKKSGSLTACETFCLLWLLSTLLAIESEVKPRVKLDLEAKNNDNTRMYASAVKIWGLIAA